MGIFIGKEIGELLVLGIVLLQLALRFSGFLCKLLVEVWSLEVNNLKLFGEDLFNESEIKPEFEPEVVSDVKNALQEFVGLGFFLGKQIVGIVMDVESGLSGTNNGSEKLSSAKGFCCVLNTSRGAQTLQLKSFCFVYKIL